MKRLFLAIIISISFLSLAQVFKDVPQNHWAYQAIESLYSAGILPVSGEKFNGDQSPSRYEMAVVVYRLKRYLEDKFERDLKSIKRKLAGLDVSSIESTLEEMKSFKLSIEDRLKSWNSVIEGMTKAFEGLKDEIAKLLKNQSNYETRLNEFGRQLGGIMFDVSNIKKALGLTENVDVGVLNRKVTDLEERLAKIEGEFRTFRESVEKRMEIAVENTDSLKEMVKDLESKLSSLEIQNVKYPSEEIETLDSSVSNLEIRLESIESRIEELSNLPESLRKNSDRISEIENEMEIMKKNNESLFEDFKILSKKIEETLKTSLDNSSTIEEIGGKVDVLKENLLRISSNLGEFRNSLETLRASVSELESRPATPECCYSLEIRISQIADELKDISTDFEKFKSSLEERLKEFAIRSEMERLEKSVSNLRETVSSSMTSLWKNLSSIVMELQNELEKAKEEIAKIKEDVSRHEDEISKMSEVIEANSSRIEKFGKSLTLLEDGVESLKKKSDANFKNLKALSSEISGALDKIENLDVRVSNLTVSVSNLATDIESVRKYSESNFKRVDARITSLESEIESLKKTVKTSTSDLRNSIESEKEMRTEIEKIVNVNKAISLTSLTVSMITLLGLVLILVVKSP